MNLITAPVLILEQTQVALHNLLPENLSNPTFSSLLADLVPYVHRYTEVHQRLSLHNALQLASRVLFHQLMYTYIDPTTYPHVRSF